MLDPDELDDVAAHFGVDATQVFRDHLISHVLAALPAEARDQLIFFGGTALARSVLPAGRMSEDIDLIAVDSRGKLAAHLTTAIPRFLRREFPDLVWSPSLAQSRGNDPAVLRNAEGLSVRIQLLEATGYPRWPSEQVDLVQRYSDAPPARMTVLTAAGFVAAKAAAWYDRAASRDLWDLWALAIGGHLTAEAADLFARLGPTPRPFCVRRSTTRRPLAAQPGRAGATDGYRSRGMRRSPRPLGGENNLGVAVGDVVQAKVRAVGIRRHVQQSGTRPSWSMWTSPRRCVLRTAWR